jgi:hypothetical protein
MLPLCPVGEKMCGGDGVVTSIVTISNLQIFSEDSNHAVYTGNVWPWILTLDIVALPDHTWP